MAHRLHNPWPGSRWPGAIIALLEQPPGSWGRLKFHTASVIGGVALEFLDDRNAHSHAYHQLLKRRHEGDHDAAVALAELTSPPRVDLLTLLLEVVSKLHAARDALAARRLDMDPAEVARLERIIGAREHTQ